jgi:hypothetical protein
LEKAGARWLLFAQRASGISILVVRGDGRREPGLDSLR